MRGRQLGIIVALCAVIGTACSSDSKKHATASTDRAPTSTTAKHPQRPTAATGPIAPLTGLRGDAAAAKRPAVTVKIENTPAARPQYGIEFADVIYEEVVEGAYTRLAAIFQSRIPAVIGPVRSVRRTDQAIVRPIRGIFVYSGGAKYAEQSIATAPVVRINETSARDAMFRDHSRRAPHNLFLRGPDIFAKAPSAIGPPPALFHYGPTPTSAVAASSVVVGFHSGYAVTWRWDATTRSWQRSIFGHNDVVASGARLQATNVVIEAVHYQGGAGVIGAEADLTGSGKAWVLSRGRVMLCTWRRTLPDAPGELVDAQGGVVHLAPGNTWVELPDTSYSVAIS